MGILKVTFHVFLGRCLLVGADVAVEAAGFMMTAVVDGHRAVAEVADAVGRSG